MPCAIDPVTVDSRLFQRASLDRVYTIKQITGVMVSEEDSASILESLREGRYGRLLEFRALNSYLREDPFRWFVVVFSTISSWYDLQTHSYSELLDERLSVLTQYQTELERLAFVLDVEYNHRVTRTLIRALQLELSDEQLRSRFVPLRQIEFEYRQFAIVRISSNAIYLTTVLHLLSSLDDEWLSIYDVRADPDHPNRVIFEVNL